MKLLKKICIVLTTISIPTATLAIDTTPVQGRNVWTVGIDAKQMFMTPVGEYRTILHANKLATSVYLAYRTQGTLGFEFGYNTTDKRSKDLIVNVGTKAFGATSQTQEIHTATVQLGETYFDIYAHARLISRVELKAGLGIGITVPKFRFYHSVAPSTTNPDPLQVALDQLRGKPSVNMRLSFGAQGLVTERLGIRALVSYENLSSIRVFGTYQNANRQIYGNAYCVSAGVYFNFYGQEEFEPL